MSKMNEINFTDFKDYAFKVELSQHFNVIHLCPYLKFDSDFRGCGRLFETNDKISVWRKGLKSYRRRHNY